MQSGCERYSIEARLVMQPGYERYSGREKKKFSNPFVQHGKIDEIKDRSNESESLWAHRPLNGLDGKSVRTNKRIGSVVSFPSPGCSP